jgi:hypothetical protein
MSGNIIRLDDTDSSESVYARNELNNRTAREFMNRALARGDIALAREFRDSIVDNPDPSEIPMAQVTQTIARPFTDTRGRLTEEAALSTIQRMNAFNEATAREQNILQRIREGNQNLQPQLTQARRAIARSGSIPTARVIRYTPP